MRTLIAYLPTLAVIIALDLLWLGVVMKDFYRAQLGHLMGDTVVWWAAILFYLVFAAGVTYFAVLPAVADGSFLRAALLGALLGLLAYATYDLTNQATLREWPVVVTLVDILWGAVLTGTAASAGYLAVKIFG